MATTTPARLTADEALEQIFKKIESLRESEPPLRELTLDKHRLNLGLFYRRGASSEPNPDYAAQKKAFDAELARGPRSSSWVARNRPDEHRAVFDADGISLIITVRDDRQAPVQKVVAPNRRLGPFHIIALVIDGPPGEQTNRVVARIGSIVESEIDAFNAASIDSAR